MATMNLLQGKFTGKVGELTGQTWKGKAIIKSAPFSKAPPTNLQTKNVRAFEALNRLASALAGLDFESLGLDKKGMLKHNAVAKFLKPAIKNHIFEPPNISDVIIQDNSAKIQRMVYSPTEGLARIYVSLDQVYTPSQDSKLFFLFFNQFGQVFYARSTYPLNTTFLVPLTRDPSYSYQCIAFLSDNISNKTYLHGFSYKGAWNMQYSLDEQDTGDLWIDGKPIYQRTFQFSLTLPAVTANTYNYTYIIDPSMSTSYVDTIIACENRGMNGNYSVIQHYAPPNSIGPQINITTNGLIIQFRSFNATITLPEGPWNGLVTIKYTKV